MMLIENLKKRRESAVMNPLCETGEAAAHFLTADATWQDDI